MSDAELYNRPTADTGREAPGTGWITFAGVMLIVSGAFKILDGLWAFKYHNKISREVPTVVFQNHLYAWGWVWLIVGIVLVLAGIAVFSGSQLARWIGILVAGVAAIFFLPWIYYQPLWTILSVTLAIFVVYALAEYGGREGPARRSRGAGYDAPLPPPTGHDTPLPPA